MLIRLSQSNRLKAVEANTKIGVFAETMGQRWYKTAKALDTKLDHGMDWKKQQKARAQAIAQQRDQQTPAANALDDTKRLIEKTKQRSEKLPELSIETDVAQMELECQQQFIYIHMLEVKLH